MHKNEDNWQLAEIDRYTLVILLLCFLLCFLVLNSKDGLLRGLFSLDMPAEFVILFSILAVGVICTVIALFFGIGTYFQDIPKEMTKQKIRMSCFPMIGGSCLCVSGGLLFLLGLLLMGWHDPQGGIQIALCGFIIYGSGLVLGVKAWWNLNTGFRND